MEALVSNIFLNTVYKINKKKGGGWVPPKLHEQG